MNAKRFAAGALALGMLITAWARAGGEGDPTALVDRKLAEWQLTPAERRFDEIGWAADLRTARRLAAEHDRPIFLFTMDGRVNTGRC
jgi:hypothetical protein